MVPQHHCCYFWWWSRGCNMFLSFPQMENLESKCSLTLGLMHDFLGLQLAHFPFLWGNTVTRRLGLHFTGENPLSLSSRVCQGFIPEPLQALNIFLQKYMFRMLAQMVLLYLVRANNWFMSVYSHIHSSQTISLRGCGMNTMVSHLAFLSARGSAVPRSDAMSLVDWFLLAQSETDGQCSWHCYKTPDRHGLDDKYKVPTLEHRRHPFWDCPCTVAIHSLSLRRESENFQNLPRALLSTQVCPVQTVFGCCHPHDLLAAFTCRNFIAGWLHLG